LLAAEDAFLFVLVCDELSKFGIVIGALTFAFVDPSEAKHWVSDYYTTLKNECVPIGHSINPNIAMVTGFSCHDSEEEARRRGLDGFQFFGFALGHHYIFGTHKPGRTNIWQMYEMARGNMPDIGGRGIGTPDQLREHLKAFSDVGGRHILRLSESTESRNDLANRLEKIGCKVNRIGRDWIKAGDFVPTEPKPVKKQTR